MTNTDTAAMGLLPCPFCGGGAALNDNLGEVFWVVCLDCGADGAADSSRGAGIGWWNRRALSRPAPAEMVEKVARAISHDYCGDHLDEDEREEVRQRARAAIALCNRPATRGAVDAEDDDMDDWRSGSGTARLGQD